MTNKETVLRFYEEFFNAHDVSAALRYVREDYIQHNPGIAQGRKGLMDAFQEKFAAHPEFKLEVQMAIAEGDMVAVYHHSVSAQGVPQTKIVDWYRLEDGKLAEHWDVLQAL